MIICSTEEIDSTSDDFGELHHALTHLPMKHDVEKLIQCALDIYLIIPPERLLQNAEDRRTAGRGLTSSRAPISRISILPSTNRRLIVYGALTVLALGLAWHRFFNPIS